MFKNYPVKSYLAYSVTAAFVYSIATYLFIRNETFNFLWVLYIGNALFGCCIVAFIILYNKKRKENASAGTMIGAGHITTIAGVVIACLITSLLFFFMPLLSHPVQDGILNNTPPQMGSGTRHEFLLSLLMNTVIGNMAAGSFVSVIISYAAKQDQKGSTSIKTSGEPDVLNQNKT
jgi:hypothetical protein